MCFTQKITMTSLIFHCFLALSMLDTGPFAIKEHLLSMWIHEKGEVAEGVTK
jgi:hypothetical protein